MQVLYIHGGTTFKNHNDYLLYLKNKEISLEGYVSWSDEYLEKSLGESFQVYRPRMPLKENAKYEEWKIMFEKYLELLEDGCILIGASLGGIFLAKYLSENKVSKRLKSVFLVCPPFDNTLPGEDLVGGFELGENLSLLDECAENVRLLFSKTDNVVPQAHAKKYQQKLQKAKIILYEDKKGHFCISEFPEIVELIQADCS